MNCRSFQNQMFEYVEETLSADARATVERHLAGCDACRHAMQKEQQLARILAARLRQSSETLKLNPGIRHHVLAAARRNPASIKVSESLTCSWGYWLRLAAIPLCLLLIAALLLAIHFSHKSRPEITIKLPMPPVASHPAQSPVSIQISYQIPTYKFQQEGNLVLDTLSYETVQANATFRSTDHQNLPQKLEMKMPL
jgi:anti-sigma-K factor RskA